ncbi:CBS domain-containing protein [Ureibacillus xyleni]|uniref:CBS domain-containing protein n=1 Tax=Ureibacillus xyleni TaxID=614648 RepID=A0A285SC81_9BACL|nr:DUF294 nucleotidyltransferase-like domain-containing protein [Ureibacillus xyleni]SOC05330.1 CBS domain-containing protein [Ureibacillus xyleni]
MRDYESIKVWKNRNVVNVLNDTTALNKFHDEVMLKVLEVAKKKLTQQPPCAFAWFITGSGGRFEQGVISDQDHGIVYEYSTIQNDEYFQALGEEVSFGLDAVGYPFCTGKIMSSNSLWRKSFENWEQQLIDWMESGSWEVIRYLQIFYDARVLEGNVNFINKLKNTIYNYQLQHPELLRRLVENIKHVKNVITPMGRIIVEQHGIYQGCINIKYAAFLPYVNSIRLLSIEEGIYETSTIDRIRKLQEKRKYEELLHNGECHFEKLLNYRLSIDNIQEYDNTHYLNIKKLSKDERRELKNIIKNGKRLHDLVIEMTLEKKGV